MYRVRGKDVVFYETDVTDKLANHTQTILHYEEKFTKALQDGKKRIGFQFSWIDTDDNEKKSEILLVFNLEKERFPIEPIQKWFSSDKIQTGE